MPAAPGADLIAQPDGSLGCAVYCQQLQVGYLREILAARHGDKGHGLDLNSRLRCSARFLESAFQGRTTRLGNR